MAIYSRYLLIPFFRYIALTFSSLIIIILITQLETLGKFASLGVSLGQLAEFVCMILLSIAPPFIGFVMLFTSALIGTRLSNSCEIIAFRSLGFSIYKIFSPLFIASLFAAFLNFYLISECATHAQRKTREMVMMVTRLNPILMLENLSSANLEGAFVKLNPVKQGSEVKELLLALPGKKLTLCLIDHAKIIDGQLKAEHLSFLSSVPNKDGFDHLVIENLDQSHAPAVELASLLSTKGWKVSNDHLSWGMLNAREKLLKAQGNGKSRLRLKKCLSEKGRRLFMALNPISCTLVGFSLSLTNPRQRSKRSLLMLGLLVWFFFFMHLFAKEMDPYPALCLTLYGLAHASFLYAGWFRLRKFSRGEV